MRERRGRRLRGLDVDALRAGFWSLTTSPISPDYRGWQDEPRILFTDHEDDLPLIRVCQTVYWFGSETARTAIQRMVPEIRLHAGFSGSLEIVN